MFLRKTTGLLLAGSIAVTTMVSAPAYADKEFNRIATIIVGAAILGSVIKKNRDDRQQVSRTYDYPDTRITPVPHTNHNGYHRHKNGTVHKHSNPGRVHKPWKREIALPKNCKRRIFYNGKTRSAFSQRCLKKQGYAVSRHGTVSHPNYYGRKTNVRIIR